MTGSLLRRSSETEQRIGQGAKTALSSLAVRGGRASCDGVKSALQDERGKLWSDTVAGV